MYELNRPFWDWLVAAVFGLDLESRLGSSVHFFFYDTVKIVLLLSGIIFAITVLRSFMSVERTRALLGGKREGVGNVLAAGLGVVTPFCSCSAVPAFIGFVSAGVPVGVTMSFLIASPLVNEVAIALLLGLFGIGPTALYVAAGLTIAVVAGLVLGRVRPQRWIEPFVFETRLHGQVIDSTARLLGRPSRDGARRGPLDPAPHLAVPARRDRAGCRHPRLGTRGLLRDLRGGGQPLRGTRRRRPGRPAHSNAAGILPLVEALYAKGLPMGTLLAFMMAVVALSLPEVILLKRVLKPPLIAAFIGVTAIGIVAVGYLFNAVL